jgi:ATPase subunit of ABC transporter with duplicated ATPase domains
MITLRNLSKSFGSRILFEDVNITFNQGHRYGLTGPNGSGKSTLLKIIMGMDSSTTGEIIMPDKVGILRQNIEDFRDTTIIDVVMMGNERLWATFQERDALYDEEMTDEIGMRLGALEEVIADEDGYSAEANAEELLQGMGISEEESTQPMKTLPTDQQFQVLLCQALFGDPQALLLDEPTNHLDMEAITWLEKFLFGYQGVLVVVSHDRHFLNSVCTHIADIDYETVIQYPGNYDDMIVAKSAVRSQAENQAKSRDKKIAKLQEFVQRFGAGSRASQVQSRKKEMDRLQPADLKASNIQRPYIKFTNTEKPPGQLLLKAGGISKSYGDLEVIRDFSLEVARGEKIGVIGNNGRGKTTLLKMLAGVMGPDGGSLEPGHGVAQEYFPQNHNDLIDKTTVKGNAFDWIKDHKKGCYDQDVRGVMGKMLFGGDDAFKNVSTLSGGETARMVLSAMMLTETNMLILDEPNNHLDLEAVSALASGLEKFSGTVIVASHDRDLIATVATRIIAFEEGGISIHLGGLDDYLASRKLS